MHIIANYQFSLSLRYFSPVNDNWPYGQPSVLWTKHPIPLSFIYLVHLMA